MTRGPTSPWHPRPRPRRDPANPRRVRSGVKLGAPPELLGESWVAARWLRLIEAGAPGAARVEGLEYAKIGQTRSLEIDAGAARGVVQGRRDKPYHTVIALDRFTSEQWELVIKEMADRSVYLARLLAGEVPTNIEDLVAPLGLKLFPTKAEELTPSCTCEDEGPWCKHAVCLATLVAERLAQDAFVIFALRGMAGEEFLERLRQHRRVAGAIGAAPVVSPHVPGVSDRTTPTLEDEIDRFWEVGPELDLIETPLEPPEVSHPLLRRLGPSPFEEGKFPMVGLLATCYEMISEAACGGSAGDELVDDLDAGPADAGSDEGEGTDED